MGAPSTRYDFVLPTARHPTTPRRRLVTQPTTNVPTRTRSTKTSSGRTCPGNRPDFAPRLPSLRDIGQAQKDDGDTQRLVSTLRDTQKAVPHLLSWMPCFIIPPRCDGRYRADSPILRVVVPAVFRADIMWHYHASELAGHLGRDKTFRRLQQRFHWPSMQADVAAYVAGCELCQRRKRPQQRHQGLLQPIRVIQPWDVVGLDIFGPLPTTRSNNRFIVVFIDHFTKWPEVIPTSSITAEVIAACCITDLFVVLAARVLC